MNICFITYMYPVGNKINSYAFVKQLVDAIAALGNHCYVLVPFNVFHYKRVVSSHETYVVGKGRVDVIRPPYVSLSGLHIGKLDITRWSHERAMRKCFKRMKVVPDVVYGHFWSSAYQGYEYARRNNIPLFVATGESEIKRLFSFPKDYAAFCKYVSGVICVSSKNKNESIELHLTTSDKCKVFPNAVNADLFKKIDQQQCRNKLGIPSNVFVVAFVGWFNDRKGSLRVAEALNKIKGEKVYSLFIGRGEQDPNCDNILFKGMVPHSDIAYYLNAADIFVLPTLNEGCCNAVVEALACGLPVVSSNLPFNWDILHEGNSIMVDPIDTDAIADAIMILRDDEILRSKMSQCALSTAKSLDISNRAKSILGFIQSRCRINDCSE